MGSRVVASVLAGLVCACGDSAPAEVIDGPAIAQDGPSGNLIFEEDFASFPGDAWFGGDSFSVEPVGMPPPSIACSAEAGSACGATLVDPIEIDPSGGVTMCAWMAIEQGGTGSFIALEARAQSLDTDAGSNANLLGVTLWSDGHVHLLLEDPVPVAGEPVEDSDFHEFCLVIGDDGAAEWQVDGAEQATGTASSAPFGIQLRAQIVAGTFVGRIDTLRITRP